MKIVRKSFIIVFILLVLLCACSRQKSVDMEKTQIFDDWESDSFSKITWDGRTYYYYCQVSEEDIGEQVGTVNGNEDDKIFEFKGYSVEEWIIDKEDISGKLMLYREESIIDIPEDFKYEYDWHD